VNALATVGTIRRFAAARRRNSHLAWRKMEHDYSVHIARIGQERFGRNSWSERICFRLPH
jgi:hypothetical protein